MSKLPATCAGSDRQAGWRGREAGWKDRLSLFFNAGWLTFGSLLSASLGFFYWPLAARAFPPAAVGYAAAALTLTNFLGHLGEMGLGPLLMANTRPPGERAKASISGALLLSFVAAVALAVIFWAVSVVVAKPLGGMGGPLGGAEFVVACGFASMSLVLDQALVAFLRSELTAARNFVQAVAKLALLIAVSRGLGPERLDEVVLFSTSLGGQILGAISLLLITDRALLSRFYNRPSLQFVRNCPGEMLRHHSLTIASMGAMLLPLLVTYELAPALNAGFNAAWALISVALLAPNALSVTVFAMSAKAPQDLPRRLRASLLASLAMAIVVGVVCQFAAHFILSLFSPAYGAMATRSLQLLGLSLFPAAIRYHYIAVQRVTGRMTRASAIVAIGSLLELGGAFVGGLHGGLAGLTVGWLAGLGGAVGLMSPTILGALFPRADGALSSSDGRDVGSGLAWLPEPQPPLAPLRD